MLSSASVTVTAIQYAGPILTARRHQNRPADGGRPPDSADAANGRNNRNADSRKNNVTPKFRRASSGAQGPLSSARPVVNPAWVAMTVYAATARTPSSAAT